MRINHSGEVAAQGLYQGQLFFETDPAIRNYLRRQLRKRLTIYGLRVFSRKSQKEFSESDMVSGQFWISRLHAITRTEKIQSFLAETERQVQAHLEKHLDIFPSEDDQARAILKKMYEDEGEHANWAENDSNGDEVKEELSNFEKLAMRVMSKVMIETSRRIQLKIDWVYINNCVDFCVHNGRFNSINNPM